jgi:hypothetical protein
MLWAHSPCSAASDGRQHRSLAQSKGHTDHAHVCDHNPQPLSRRCTMFQVPRALPFTATAPTKPMSVAAVPVADEA